MSSATGKRFGVQVRSRGAWRNIKPVFAAKASPPYSMRYTVAKIVAARYRRKHSRVRVVPANVAAASRKALVNRWVDGKTERVDAQLLYRLALVGKSINQTVSIQSGFRSTADQQRLYDLYLAGKGAPANPPGKSLHEKGLAVDANVNGINIWSYRGAISAAKKYGLFQPYAHEPWHVEKAR